jgi:hypothetical protein
MTEDEARARMQILEEVAIELEALGGRVDGVATSLRRVAELVRAATGPLTQAEIRREAPGDPDSEEPREWRRVTLARPRVGGGGPLCGATAGAATALRICDLPRGHEGGHATHGADGRLVACWPESVGAGTVVRPRVGGER